MSKCLVCSKEITDTEYMVDGRPAVASWIPYGAPQSVYAIVTAHITCMTEHQLTQALKSWEIETKKRGYPALVVGVVEARLSHLLAGGARGPAPNGNDEGSRFSWLEVDK